jgi:hypothetical protein
MDIQQRSPEYGHRRDNTRPETEIGCVNSTKKPR